VFYREALALRPAEHLRGSYLYNLASAFTERFGQCSRQDDLEAAIASHREALKLQPAPHPHRDASLNALGTRFMRRFEQCIQQEDLKQAFHTFKRHSSCDLHHILIDPCPSATLKTRSSHNSSNPVNTKTWKQAFHAFRRMAPTVEPPPSLPDETPGHSTAVSLATTLEQLSDLIYGLTLPKNKAAKSATMSLHALHQSRDLISLAQSTFRLSP
jgi:hypothetical protein